MSSPAVQSTVPDDQAPVLVGRERERALLSRQLASALAGRGGLVLLGGEAGIGKTALAEALAREATERGALVLVGRCYDLSETPPYGPWREALAQVPHAPDYPSPPAIVVEGHAAGVTSQEALFAQMRDFFAAMAARQPLVLFLDDLHWADPASLELLRYLARQLPGLPALLLVTYRADELTRRHPLYQVLPLLVREARAVRLDLRPLDEGDVRTLVAARYGLAAGDEARLVGYLQARAEGNAFFIGELLHTLEGAGLIRAADGGWALRELVGTHVPPLLRQVIDGRLARLGEEARELLAMAAVIGQEVPLDLWAAVGQVGEDALLDVIERATDAHVLAGTAEGVRFGHALIREALYEGTLPLRRRIWHRRVAEALMAMSTPASGSPEPDAVAYHLHQAGDPRAADWLVRAGERAQRAFASLTAAARFEAAVALMEGDEARVGERGWLLYRLVVLRDYGGDQRQNLAAMDEAARLAAVAGDRALAAVALFRRGRVHFMLGEKRRALALLEAGVAAVEALPPDELARLARSVTPDGGASVIDRYRSYLLLNRGLMGPYPEVAALGERLVGQVLDPDSRYYTYLGLALAYAQLGRPAAAQRAFAEGRAVARARGDHFGVAANAELELKLVALPYEAERVAARRRLAAEVETEFGQSGGVAPFVPRQYCLPLLLLEGQWAEARALALEGSTGALNAGARAAAKGWLGMLARGQGEPDLAWAQVRAGLPDGPATEPEDVGTEEPRLLRLAAALSLDAGELATARAWLECHDRWLARSGVVLGQADGQLGWAAYHRAVGDLALAPEHAERALAHAAEPRQPLALLAAHRLLGVLDTAAGRHADAAAHLDDALALAEACAAPYERALTLLALAELRAATGQQGDAQRLLDEARAICTPLGARPALGRAEALAARLAAPTPTASSPAYPAGLTAREVEVLRLVAQGLSDAQIAERLYVSVHTVKTHLRAIYGKLDVPSRTAAARIATEHGLT